MITLNSVEQEIKRQLERDYSERNAEEIKNMCVLGLSEEAGEVAGIFKRKLRNFERDQNLVTRLNLKEELGDVLWYLTAVCILSNISLEDVWERNCEKLEERYGH